MSPTMACENRKYPDMQILSPTAPDTLHDHGGVDGPGRGQHTRGDTSRMTKEPQQTRRVGGMEQPKSLPSVRLRSGQGDNRHHRN